MDEKVTESNIANISKPDLSSKRNNFLEFLIYDYLEGVNKVLAAKFLKKISLTKYERTSEFPTLQDVVVHFYDSNQQSNNFLDFLIYDYLQCMNTQLAAKFMKKVNLPKLKRAEDFPTLQDVVVHFHKTNQQENVHNTGNVQRIVKSDTRGKSKLGSISSVNKNGLAPQCSQKRRRQNRFTDHEVQVLREYIEKYSDKICYRKLGKELGRHRNSVWAKIQSLKKGTSENGKCSLFTLEEDYFIIDCVLSGAEDIVNIRALDVNKNKSKFVAEQLHRNDNSVYKRWESVLKHWILSYYCGALNLNINSFLINYLSSIYKYHDSVDWSEVIKRPEFAGHTRGSLINCLSTVKMSWTAGG